MKKSIFKKTRRLLVAVFALFFSITFLVIGMPKAKAATFYPTEIKDYKLIDSLDLWAVYDDSSSTTHGSFTFSKNTASKNTDPAVSWRFEKAGESASVTFTNTTSKTISNYLITVDADYYAGDERNDEVKIEIKDGTTIVETRTIFANENNVTFSKSSTSGYSNTITLVFTANADPKMGSSLNLWIHEFSVYEDDPGKPVNITGGAGIKSVFLSTSDTATSGSESGTGFEDGDVYGFVVLDKGYNKGNSDWNLVSGTDNTEGAIYCVGKVKVEMESSVESYNIGTFNATPKTLSLSRNGNGGADGSSVTLTYDQEATVPGLERTGCAFSGWNTKDDGTGDSYTENLSVDDVNKLILSYTANFYAQWEYNAAIKAVIDKINDIEMAYSSDCEEAIEEAYAAYGALDEEDKVVFPESSYDLLVSKDYAYEAMDKIHNIGTIANTTESKALVDAAKSFYDGLYSDTQALVLPAYVKTLNDCVAVMDLITKVNAIGALDDSTECRDKIDAAIDAYSDMTDEDQLNMIPNGLIDTLNDKDSAKTVIDKIKAIGNVVYPDSKNDIDEAKTAYNALTVSQKALISKEYSDNLDDADTDYNKVDEFVTKVNNIPAFEYNDEYKTYLDETKEMYDLLTDTQKGIVPNNSKTKLNEAINEYNAVDVIFNIGEIENTPESRNRVRKAKEAFDALTDEQRAAIPTERKNQLNDAVAVFDVIDMVNAIKNAGYSSEDKAAIDAAKEAYEALTKPQKDIFPQDTLAMLVNIEKAYPVMVTINQIGGLEYSDTFKDKIDTAKKIFDNLSENQKVLVKNYVVLSVYIQSYNRIDSAYKAIENIEKVKYNKTSKEQIEEARFRYNKLDKDERSLLTNSEKLIQAENKYQSAKHSHNVGMGWLAGILSVLFIAGLAIGIYFLVIFLKKKRREENNKNVKTK